MGCHYAPTVLRLNEVGHEGQSDLLVTFGYYLRRPYVFFVKRSPCERSSVHHCDSRCTNPLTPGLNDLPRLAGLVWDQGEERDQDMSSRKRQTLLVIHQIYVVGYVTVCPGKCSKRLPTQVWQCSEPGQVQPYLQFCKAECDYCHYTVIMYYFQLCSFSCSSSLASLQVTQKLKPQHERFLVSAFLRHWCMTQAAIDYDPAIPSPANASVVVAPRS